MASETPRRCSPLSISSGEYVKSRPRMLRFMGWRLRKCKLRSDGYLLLGWLWRIHSLPGMWQERGWNRGFLKGDIVGD